jgi:hypothetical protein
MKKILGICAVLMALTIPVLAQDADDNRRQDDRDDAVRRDNRGYGQGQWRSPLSSEDQQRFDSYYSRWLEYRRANNRDEIVSMENRMRDVMSRNNIPSNVPFEQIASNGNQGYGGYYGQRRASLSSEDQRQFDSYYSRWLEYRRTNNRGEIVSMENRMRDVMSRNNIPSNVPFEQIASNGDQGYGRHYGQRRARLSSEDQQRFDSYYSRWLEYRRTNNRDEIVSMENRMRDVMSHNNIPSNVPFEQIASRR